MIQGSDSDLMPCPFHYFYLCVLVLPKEKGLSEVWREKRKKDEIPANPSIKSSHMKSHMQNVVKML
jgi:hypothetical protein